MASIPRSFIFAVLGWCCDRWILRNEGFLRAIFVRSQRHGCPVLWIVEIFWQIENRKRLSRKPSTNAMYVDVQTLPDDCVRKRKETGFVGSRFPMSPCVEELRRNDAKIKGRSGIGKRRSGVANEPMRIVAMSPVKEVRILNLLRFRRTLSFTFIEVDGGVIDYRCHNHLCFRKSSNRSGRKTGKQPLKGCSLQVAGRSTSVTWVFGPFNF